MTDSLNTRVSNVALYLGMDLIKEEYTPDVKAPDIIDIYFILSKIIDNKEDIPFILKKLTILNRHFRFGAQKIDSATKMTKDFKWELNIYCRVMSFLPLETKWKYILSYKRIKSHSFISKSNMPYINVNLSVLKDVICSKCYLKALEDINDKYFILSDYNLSCNEFTMKGILE
jgi:hypothetical protein